MHQQRTGGGTGEGAGAIRRAYADGPFGQIHYAQRGQGEPLLLLHQTPRSWDEFEQVMLLLPPSRRMIAMDLPGMGASDAPPSEPTIESYGDAAAALLQALELPPADVFGHHTGAFVAADLAARHPRRVRTLTLSAPAWVDDSSRAAKLDPNGLPVDNASPVPSGEHLLELWRQRQPFYPKDRTDLLSVFLRDALRVRDPRDGHIACYRYTIERAVERIACPTLLLGHDRDPHSFGDFEKFRSRLPHAAAQTIQGGMVPLEWRAQRVAEAIDGFLSR
ncbi:MAG: alpha/beta fold hydrolase [Solirubrobacteraceae bacterium]